MRSKPLVWTHSRPCVHRWLLPEFILITIMKTSLCPMTSGARRRLGGPVARPWHSGCALVALLLSLNTWAQNVLEAPFTRVTSGPVPTQLGMWTAPAWGDYDNDGWLDLFVANFDPAGRNALFHNNLDGTFSRVNTGPIPTETSAQTFGVAWADYDNDGWMDLIISSNSRVFQPCRLYRNTGGGSFVRMLSAEVGSLASDVSHGFGVAWGDYDRDGYLDLFVANGAADIPQKDFLYHNEGNGRFTRITNSMTAPTLATVSGAWTDYDNDGKLDLFLTHVENGNALFRPTGGTEFSDMTGSAGLGDVPSVGTAWGDYDNDGDLDLLVVNMSNGGPITPNWFYRNRGDRTFEGITQGTVAEDQDHFVSGTWVDYDNDGWMDLFVTVLGPGSSAADGVFNRLYHNEGDGTFQLVTRGPLVTQVGGAGGAAWGDYDNDGFLDVCVAYGTVFSSKANALYRNNGNSNDWIKVRCVGTISNRSAIGTKVRVKAKIGGQELRQLRHIGCNQDWVTFNGLDAVFGLGDATLIDTLRVEWPSGIVQEFHNVSAKQTLTIVERTDLTITSSGSGKLEVKLHGPRQQNYRIESSTNLTTWSPVASLIITNADATVSFERVPAESESRRFFRALPE